MLCHSHLDASIRASLILLRRDLPTCADWLQGSSLTDYLLENSVRKMAVTICRLSWNLAIDSNYGNGLCPKPQDLAAVKITSPG